MWETEPPAHGPCGTFEWEWEENPTTWWPDVKRCRGCQLQDEFKRAFKRETENRPPSDLDGLYLRMFRTQREDPRLDDAT